MIGEFRAETRSFAKVSQRVLIMDLQYTIGLDLGRTRNHTALVVMERTWQAATPAEFIASGTQGYSGEFRHTVVGADRLALGTPYTRVTGWVKGIVEELGASRMGEIVVDASGLGSVVMDHLRAARMGASLLGVVITGEQASGLSGAGHTSAGYVTVSRTELLTKLQVAVQERKFRIDRARCREWEALRRELATVRIEGGGSKGGKRQDDLALALALAIWRGLR